MAPEIPGLGVETIERQPPASPGMPDRRSTISAAATARDLRARIAALRPSKMAQFRALMAKNGKLQLRQTRTNLTQIIFPLSMILLLMLFQVLIDGLLKDNPDFAIPADVNPAVFPIFPTLGYGVRNSTDCDKITAQNMTHIATFPAQDLYVVQNQPAAADSIGTYSPVPFLRRGFLGNVSVSFEAKISGSTISLPGYIAYFLGNTRAFSRTRCLTKVQLAPIAFNTSVAGGSNSKPMQDLIYEWWTTYTKSILGAVEVNDLRYQPHQAQMLMNYTVISNKTLSDGHEDGFWMAIMNSAFVKSISQHRLKFAGLKNVPRPTTAVSFDLAALMGPFLLIYVFQLQLPVALSGFVFDREEKLLEIMKMMGLKTTIYFYVSYLFNFLLYVSAIGLMYGLAIALNISIFTMNDPLVLIIGFTIWGNVQIALSYFLSVFFSKSKTSIVLGYFYVFGSGLVASQVVSDYFTSEATPRSTMLGLQAFPPFVLYRMLVILGNNVAFGATGLKLADISEPDVQMDEVWIIMAIQYAILMVLGLYLDQVLPQTYGVRRHPLFFLQKSFWFGEQIGEDGDESAYPALEIADHYEHEPFDVAADRKALKAGPRHDLLLKVLDITKEFPAPRGSGLKKKVAVDRLSLGVSDRSCFGFLGPNGAGKTTLINMLSGLIVPTRGTAFVGDMDIRTAIDQIHAGMGVCPQDNILWDDLTGREHLVFYARLKNLNGQELDDAVAKALADVNLSGIPENKKSGEYSGGMKRRLSVACALIGNPMLVLLDEPTTGLDPASRRQLWEVVREYKSNSLVLLTTHSLEEADSLCDRLCIVDSGHILCVGEPAELKSRYGRGFKLTIIVHGGKAVEERAVNALAKHFDNITVINTLGGVVNLELPNAGLKLYEVFETMEQVRLDQSLGISDWAVENSSLEEVFLRVVGVLGDVNDGGGAEGKKTEWV